MNPVDRRIVELTIIGKHRPLSATEAREWEESRKYAIDREWRLARVLNLMPLARQKNAGKDGASSHRGWKSS